MSESIKELKNVLRRKLRVESKNYSPVDRAAASEQICLRLKQQPLWRQAQSVLFYLPLAEEPDVYPLLPEALAAGKVVTLPRYSAVEDAYVPCQVENLAGDLQPGQYGIREPVPACATFDLNKLDFLLVPGVGFTSNGSRLGRGKGYYDRLLARARGVKCGVAFDWQVSVEVPLEPHDVCLDCILTPTRWLQVVQPRRS
jgi:5-formyltetrahydrofolate cyclo-ligase